MRLYSFLSGLALVFLAIAGCKKDGTGPQGAPVIHKVTTTLSYDNEITSGALNQWVIIHGRNLSGTRQLFFEDLEVPYEEIYSSDTLVSAKIPRRIPQEVTKTLRLTTDQGSTTYEFEVAFPELKFTRLKNEYTAEGEVLEIEGDNFDLYFEQENIRVEFTGGVTATVQELTPTSLKLVVPAGAAPGPLLIDGGAPLNVEMNTGETWYMDNRNFMLQEPVLEPAAGLVNSDPDFPNNPAPMLIKRGSYEAWGWDTFLSAYINFPAEAIANPAGYVIKFEMNTKVPITSGDIIFRLGNNNYYRWPYNFYGTNINTNNQWETLSVPLNLVAMDPNDHAYVQLILSDGSSRVTNYAFCNFRIVPK